MNNETKNGDRVTSSSEIRGSRRTLIGTVISDKMDKTVVVEVSRRVLERRFGKYLTKRTKYKVHSESNQARKGDKILMVETRPISKEKRWKVQKILEQNRSTQENV